MIVAMFVGMAILGMAGAGVEALTDLELPGAPEPAALKMAVDMSVGMMVWMRYRRHGWAGTLEMVGAMLVPVAVFVPLSWLGVISGELLMIIMHVVMLPLVLVVMLHRRAEYATAIALPPAAGSTGGTRVLIRRRPQIALWHSPMMAPEKRRRKR
jgi:flagellar biosynthetic protein FliP